MINKQKLAAAKRSRKAGPLRDHFAVCNAEARRIKAGDVAAARCRYYNLDWIAKPTVRASAMLEAERRQEGAE